MADEYEPLELRVTDVEGRVDVLEDAVFEDEDPGPHMSDPITAKRGDVFVTVAVAAFGVIVLICLVLLIATSGGW